MSALSIQGDMSPRSKAAACHRTPKRRRATSAANLTRSVANLECADMSVLLIQGDMSP